MYIVYIVSILYAPKLHREIGFNLHLTKDQF